MSEPTLPPSPSTPSPSPSKPPLRRFDFKAWKPSRAALLWTALAFVAGLLLFLMVWLGGRDTQKDFYRAGPDATGTAGPDYAPLPAPLPAGADNASGMGTPPEPTPEGGERPALVETTPPPPPAAPASPAAPPSPPRAVASSAPEPLPGQTPSPQYPRQALRRGESGTVIVLAQVGPDGVPTTVSVDQTSGSRALDRAALDAVRRWRFRPAMKNGQPTVDSVRVPIVFSP